MPIKLHESISADLLEQIQRGDLRAGERIPSSSELQKHYQVSHVTVLNAFKCLATDGWIERQDGLGYFVRSISQHAATSAVLSLMRPFDHKTVMDNYINCINVAIQSALYVHRFHLIWPYATSGLLSRPASPDALRAIVDTAVDFAPEVSGILLDELIDDQSIARIQDAVDVPLVLVNRATDLSVPALVPANSAGSERAAQYALKLGYEHFAICQCPQNPNLIARCDAFADALDAGSVEPAAISRLDGFLGLQHPASVVSLKSLLDGPGRDRRVLVFTPTDYLGRLICDDLIRWGRQPGEDIGLISFDALGYANMMSPQLTTVDPQPGEIGRLAVEMLLTPPLYAAITNHEAPFTLALGETT